MSPFSPCALCDITDCPPLCPDKYRYLMGQGRPKVNITESTMIQISTQAGQSPKDQQRLEAILEDVLAELLLHADEKHPPMDGIEEGYCTIKAEIAELKREMRRSTTNHADARAEAIQVAAMGIKMLRDCFTAEGEMIR